MEFKFSLVEIWLIFLWICHVMTMHNNLNTWQTLKLAERIIKKNLPLLQGILRDGKESPSLLASFGATFWHRASSTRPDHGMAYLELQSTRKNPDFPWAPEIRDFRFLRCVCVVLDWSFLAGPDLTDIEDEIFKDHFIFLCFAKVGTFDRSPPDSSMRSLFWLFRGILLLSNHETLTGGNASVNNNKTQRDLKSPRPEAFRASRGRCQVTQARAGSSGGLRQEGRPCTASSGQLIACASLKSFSNRDSFAAVWKHF